LTSKNILVVKSFSEVFTTASEEFREEREREWRKSE
jgi:hypothetical protein